MTQEIDYASGGDNADSVREMYRDEQDEPRYQALQAERDELAALVRKAIELQWQRVFRPGWYEWEDWLKRAGVALKIPTSDISRR